jgi:acyl carrier protein
MLDDKGRTMTKDEVRQAILDILADIAPDEDMNSINDEATLREQIDLDSMDFLDIVMELRKRFNIEVPEKDYEQLVSMASCIQYLQPILNDRQLAS